MDPSKAVLARRYAFAEGDAKKAEEWGEQLWLKLRIFFPSAAPKILKAPDTFEYLNDRLTNYVHSRLVVRGCQIMKAMAELPEDAIELALSDAVEDVLDLTETDRLDIAWLLMRICGRANTNKGSAPTKAQSAAITQFAYENGHRCYLCGDNLVFTRVANEEFAKGTARDTSVVEFDLDGAPVPHRRAFEIEHIFPQKRGGGRSRRNLAACCEACNKYKDVLLSFADLSIETMITSSTDPEKLTKLFGGKQRFALLWRQNGNCGACSGPFHNAHDERLLLRRRNLDDSFHFHNVEIICGDCDDLNATDRIELRA